MVPWTAALFEPTEEAFISLPALTMSFMRNIRSDTPADVADACTRIPSYALNPRATDFHCWQHIKNTVVTTLPEQSGTPASHF